MPNSCGSLVAQIKHSVEARLIFTRQIPCDLKEFEKPLLCDMTHWLSQKCSIFIVGRDFCRDKNKVVREDHSVKSSCLHVHFNFANFN